MSRFFPDPHGPVNQHPGPDFDRPPANPHTTEAGKTGAQHDLARTAAASRAFMIRAPHQEAEAS